MKPAAPDAAQLERMCRDWDRRARKNARHYIHTGRLQWDDGDFFDSGRQNVRETILNDLENICQGRDPKQMKILEIGCGVGRMTRALAEFFGEVYAVDVSGEMIARARQALAGLPNVHLFQNNGADLAVLGGRKVDFAFSYIVFQHVPDREIVRHYVREVYRLLEPGGLFKFQVQGNVVARSRPDTWRGIHFSESDAVQMAEDCGFEPRYRAGAGTQFFWLWFFKP